jgi:hypothetical protein
MNTKKILKTDGHAKPRPPFNNFIQLPNNQMVTYMTTYAPERIVYPKWQFWRKQVTNYILVIATDKNRVYMVDTIDGFPTVSEKKSDA